MVLARVLGDGAFRERVKIYATDIDEEALDQGRLGAYQPRQVEDVPRRRTGAVLRADRPALRVSQGPPPRVIFGRNDLVQDAPISRIDLLVCRNTLMYFTAETQRQVLAGSSSHLWTGVLLLGKSEMLITHAELFTPVDLKWRMFRKGAKPTLRDRVRVLAQTRPTAVPEHRRQPARAGVRRRPCHSWCSTPAALVMANALARRLFGLGVGDFGRPVQDLELSYRPLELRTHLDVA